MKKSSSLFPKLKQLEVDFVIPRVVGDLPLCIDPFLLFKSRDPEFRTLHAKLLSHFASGMRALQDGDTPLAERILTFPEVSEIGLGYGTTHKRGSGLGAVLRRLLIDTLKASPAILDRGIRHIEEMQLISPGIGPDRIGDIAGNVFKSYLISYTQRQAALHGLPIQSGVPVQHVYEESEQIWLDGYFDLPVNEVDGAPVILVPRRMVRHLPWINYDNFVRTEFKAYLAARRTKAQSQEAIKYSKASVTATSRVEIQILDSYIKQRERDAAQALPYMPADDEMIRSAADHLLVRLSNIPAGARDASAYQQLVLDILTFIFSPDLIDGRLEARTFDGTERRDIIFTNDSDSTFLSYVRNAHDALMIMFEVKNMTELTMGSLNQAATYLGDRIGRFGMIVTRQPPGDNIVRKQISIFNDSQPRKVLLILSDTDLRELIEIRATDKSPVTWVQKRYRDFKTSAQ